MSILVIGGTGTIGSHIVRGLLTQGEAVRILARSANHADLLPLGANDIIGDLRKPETLRCAMKGIDRVFLVWPLSRTQGEEGRAVVAAANCAGVRYFVYLSVYHVEQAPYVPHFKSKMEIQGALSDSGMHRLPGWLVPDLKLMYEFFQRRGLRATEEDFALQAKVLSHHPRCFHAFVKETVAAWERDGSREHTKVG